MPDIAGRLNRVEKTLGARRDCHCGPRGARGSSFYFPDDGEARPDDTCERCGGQMVIIEVLYEKPDFPNYALGESVMYE